MFKQLLLILLLLMSQHSFSDGPKGYPFYSFDEAMKLAKEQSKPVFVYFGRYGCGYCEKTNVEAFSSAEVKQIYTSHYVLAYVDSESGKRLRLPTGERITERELGTRYKAFVTPVFSYLSTEGKKMHQIVGVQSKESLLEADKNAQVLLSKAKSL
ncbi:MAG: thioredoxin family protein [Gammaproteobacteria bacterium]|nr:thioredoxin family protein [Gammaproteobacteria bacterium]